MSKIRGKVLLVDDDARDRAFYREILRAVGFEVSPCHSYQEGARRVCQEAFDFIVVSQGSLAFEGREVLERAVETDRDLPVLVLAPCLHMEAYLDAMQLGAADYLEKSVPPERLVWAIETHLRKSSPVA